jgi:mannose/fructose/N-acetylgalactosamine-specific phosphotransferase system component IID
MVRPGDPRMNDALRELFTTDVGLMSLGAIVGVVVIGAFMHSWVRRQIRKDEMRNGR